MNKNILRKLLLMIGNFKYRAFNPEDQRFDRIPEKRVFSKENLLSKGNSDRHSDFSSEGLEFLKDPATRGSNTRINFFHCRGLRIDPQKLHFFSSFLSIALLLPGRYLGIDPRTSSEKKSPLRERSRITVRTLLVTRWDRFLASEATRWGLFWTLKLETNCEIRPRHNSKEREKSLLLKVNGREITFRPPPICRQSVPRSPGLLELYPTAQPTNPFCDSLLSRLRILLFEVVLGSRQGINPGGFRTLGERR
jgi:hypothetical protein